MTGSTATAGTATGTAALIASRASISNEPADVSTVVGETLPERAARKLYQRYGGKPWADLPESTRVHFRNLLAAGVDGAGRPIDALPMASGY